MTKREPDIKTRILLAAKKLFALQGYDGTSVRQICDEAGANLSLVSYHFGGKEKVFEALFERYFLVRLPDGPDSSKSPVQGLTLIIRELIRFTALDREMSDIVQLEMALRTKRNAAMYPFLEPIWTKLTELLQQGKDQGIFRIESVSYSMLMVLSVSLSPQRAFNTRFMVDFGQENPDHLADQTVIFALRGLGVNQQEWTSGL